MPATSTWKPRIPHIVNSLRADERKYVSRADIERLLEVSRSQADAVMRASGNILTSAELGLAGKMNWLAVENLVDYLECHFDASAKREFERRERVERKLQEAKQEQPLKQVGVRFRDKAPVVALLRSGIEDIPGVTITPPNGHPGRIEIEFSDAVECLGRFILLALAIANHQEQFHQMVTPVSQGKLEGM